MPVPDDGDARSPRGASAQDRTDRTSPDEAPKARQVEGQVGNSRSTHRSGKPDNSSLRPSGRHRRNRRDANRSQPDQVNQDQSSSVEPAEVDLNSGGSAGARPPAGPGTSGRPLISPKRPGPIRQNARGADPELRRHRTEGTRPPDQGNGRGLSGSPRNPNHYGEIPIRPDNSTFDPTHDRLVCIARNRVIPEDFPVQYRRMTASSRLNIVATSGPDLLLCDLSHNGPHVWPDQTVVHDLPPAEPTSDRDDRMG